MYSIKIFKQIFLEDQPSDDLQTGEGTSYVDGSLKEDEGPSDVKRMKKLKEKLAHF